MAPHCVRLGERTLPLFSHDDVHVHVGLAERVHDVEILEFLDALHDCVRADLRGHLVGCIDGVLLLRIYLGESQLAESGEEPVLFRRQLVSFFIQVLDHLNLDTVPLVADFRGCALPWICGQLKDV